MTNKKQRLQERLRLDTLRDKQEQLLRISIDLESLKLDLDKSSNIIEVFHHLALARVNLSMVIRANETPRPRATMKKE